MRIATTFPYLFTSHRTMVIAHTMQEIKVTDYLNGKYSHRMTKVKFLMKIEKLTAHLLHF